MKLGSRVAVHSRGQDHVKDDSPEAGTVKDFSRVRKNARPKIASVGENSRGPRSYDC